VGEASELNRVKAIVERLVKKKREVPPNRVWVREIAQCLRRSWYERHSERRVSDALVIGAEVHSWIEEADIPEDIADAVVDVPMIYQTGGVNIVGRADIVTHDSVIEVKVSRDPRPREEHVRQGCYYKKILGKEKLYIAIVHVPTNNIVAYRIDNCYDDMEERAQRLFESLVLNKRPPQELGQWCQYCAFYNQCMDDARKGL